MLDCAGGSTVHISNSSMYGVFKGFECSEYQAPESRLTGMKAPNGKTIAEVGYPLGEDEFLPIIDEIVVSRLSCGYIPRWAHYTLRNFPKKDDTTKPKLMTKGPLSCDIDYDKAYNRNLQRKALKTAFKDDSIVNSLMPAQGN